MPKNRGTCGIAILRNCNSAKYTWANSAFYIPQSIFTRYGPIVTVGGVGGDFSHTHYATLEMFENNELSSLLICQFLRCI